MALLDKALRLAQQFRPGLPNIPNLYAIGSDYDEIPDGWEVAVNDFLKNSPDGSTFVAPYALYDDMYALRCTPEFKSAYERRARIYLVDSDYELSNVLMPMFSRVIDYILIRPV